MHIISVSIKWQKYKNRKKACKEKKKKAENSPEMENVP